MTSVSGWLVETGSSRSEPTCPELRGRARKDWKESFVWISEDEPGERGSVQEDMCGKFCQNLKEGPQRFAYQPCVLGTPCFFSGSHYWEAEVGEGKEWALGVCKKSIKRKRKSSFSSEHGFCIISMKAGTIYTGSILETRIPASPGLSQVGIFLDTELEEIKFFDVRNDALIYIYSSFSCLEPLCPFFCPELPGEGGSGAPLIICPPEIHPFLEASCEVNEVFDVRNVRMTQEETVLEDL
ncbi:ret finger protein-like 4B-like protein [Camelus ferus]|nr:ret finger protein-like 4B-like protein [Camelus ferus]